MNRFRVAKGCEATFEHVWLSRDSHLDKVPGFVAFHLLKGPVPRYPTSTFSDRTSAVRKSKTSAVAALTISKHRVTCCG
jgi:heme-degrading monooxygenase HmoA